MMEAEQVYALVEVEEALGGVMQAKKLLMTAIDVVDGEASFAKLRVEGLAEARANVQQAEEAGGIESAAVTEAGANQMIVVGRDGLEHVQHGNRVLEHLVGAADQGAGIGVVAVFNQGARAAEVKSNALQQDFRALMDHLDRK